MSHLHSTSTTKCTPALAELQSATTHSLASREFARYLDSQDELAFVRNEFIIPGQKDGDIYFNGHALGPMPGRVKGMLAEELTSWSETGAPGHSKLRDTTAKPWTAGHESGGIDERYTDVMADLIGARPEEVAWMGGLTSNLHALFNAFYRPDKNGRFKILYEANAFPSDRYAFRSQALLNELDPHTTLLPIRPTPGTLHLKTSDILDIIHEQGDTISVIIFGAIHWETGQLLDMEAITTAGKAAGCIVGWDCAHAVGNVPMELHDWGVDFAVWCTYKYLFSGPGATAGIFIHERNFYVPRQAGWWGHELDSRFIYAPDFKPRQGAAGFAVSNPSVLGTIPVHASMQIFKQISTTLNIPSSAVIQTIRQKSILLTGYLEYLITLYQQHTDIYVITIITPQAASERGSCLSLRISSRQAVHSDTSAYSPALKGFCEALEGKGVIVDKRAPDLVRLSPSAVYSTFEEVWRLGEIVRSVLM